MEQKKSFGDRKDKMENKTNGSVKAMARCTHMLSVQKIWIDAYKCRYVGIKL